MDREKYRLEQRTEVANNPNTWLRHAKSLKKAAGIIYEQIDKIEDELVTSPSSPTIWPIYLMLSGLALENLIKGIYVTKNGALDGGGDLNNLLTHHKENKIRLLSNENKIEELDNQDYFVIERLEQYVDSWGRYGIEKKVERKNLKSIPEGDQYKIPMTGAVRNNAKEILKKNDGGDYSELPTINNYFSYGNDQIQIDKTYEKLEKILQLSADLYRPYS